MGSQPPVGPLVGEQLAAANKNTEASEKEAQAVAAAIGLPARSLSKLSGLRRPAPEPDDEGAPLVRMKTGASESVGADSPSPTGAFVVSGENSPEFEPLDSPGGSDEEGGGGGGDEGDEKTEESGDERRGRSRGMDEGAKRTGAKKFVFPKERRKSEGG